MINRTPIAGARMNASDRDDDWFTGDHVTNAPDSDWVGFDEPVGDDDFFEGNERSAAHLLQGLNPVQVEAVRHTRGPLLVVAGAGSGKTRVLTHRIAYLVGEAGVRPGNILAITFTNKAADEMKNRISPLVGAGRARWMWVSTFHSACTRILRHDIGRLGYDRSFSIYDSSDAQRLVSLVLRELNLDIKRFPPRQIHSAISAAKNELIDPEAYAAVAHNPFERRISEVYSEYQRRLKDASALDFDDLLVLTVKLFQAHPDVLDLWRRRFQHIMVDEFQDTNAVQWELVRLLAEQHRNVMVVGDADQSIYKFRGADARNLLLFEQTFPEARVLVLDQNYRSTQVILDAANAVISNNQDRREKHLWTDKAGGEQITLVECNDEHDEASYVVNEINRLTGEGDTQFSDIAVFYRTNAQSRVIEELLVRHGVPYKVVGGLRFYDRREVRDGLAYVRALVNPSDEVSVRRIVNVPRRGVGDTSMAKIESYAQGAGIPIMDALREAQAAGVRGKAVAGIARFVDLMDELTDMSENATTAEMLEAVLERSGYLAELEAERTIESQGRIENLQELIGVAREFDDLLARGALSGPAANAVSGVVDQARIDSFLAVDGGAATSFDSSEDGVVTGFDAPEGSDGFDVSDGPGDFDEHDDSDEYVDSDQYADSLASDRLTVGRTGVDNDADGDRALADSPRGVARLQAFLETVSLVTDLDEAGEVVSQVTLMTLHTAKGLEYPVVFLTGLEEGVFPHSRSLSEPDELEEERRLCYVGITRAQDRLYLTQALSRTLYGATDYNPPSRFLTEIPEALIRRARKAPQSSRRRRLFESEPEGRVFGRGGAGYHSYDDDEDRPRRRSSRDRVLGKNKVAPVTGDRFRQRRPEEPPANLDFGVGDDVVHHSFGEGTVLEISGGGDKTEVLVRFAGVGEKRLLLAWAPLQKVN